MKELNPEFVATASHPYVLIPPSLFALGISLWVRVAVLTSPLPPRFVLLVPRLSLSVCSVDVHEGHPFSVEAAVSLGGAKAKPGVSVYRYANRIPLLFEGSNDVVSVVANTRIKSDTQARAACF